MKQLLKLFPAILMIAAISFAGCGDKGDAKKGDAGTKTDPKSEKKDDKGATNTPAASEPVASTDAAADTAGDAKFVATKVSLPNMHWTWGSCRNQVSSALTALPEVNKESVDVDAKTKELRFEATEGFDVASKLQELSGEIKYFKDFKIEN